MMAAPSHGVWRTLGRSMRLFHALVALCVLFLFEPSSAGAIEISMESTPPVGGTLDADAADQLVVSVILDTEVAQVL